MSRRKRAVLELNFDSFLDIVANLVGILIILVVIVGAQSRKAVHESAIEQMNRSAEVQQFRDASAQAAAARTAVQRIRGEINRFDGEIQSRQYERNVMLDMLSAAREQWDQQKSQLNRQQQDAATTISTLASKEQRLQELVGERTALESSQSPVVVVEHLPSPMAKTVFGEEVHFRLHQGRLTVVPIDSLIEAIRENFRRAVDGTRPGSNESTIGPIRGYTARYEVERSRAMVQRGGTVSTALRSELTGLVIEPVEENLGEPITQVLTSGRSLLDIELAGRDPATTTVTVWVYPDSFADFRRLKEYLYARGFATAARPLPEGTPISGGPRGSRSAAQ